MTKKGYILIPVLVLLALISLTGLQISSSICRDQNRLQREWRKEQAYQAAMSAQEYARWIIEHEDNTADSFRSNIRQPVEIDIDGSTVTLSITDEQSRLNLMKLLYPSGEADIRYMGIFQRLTGLETEPIRQTAERIAERMELFHFQPVTPRLLIDPEGVDGERIFRLVTVYGNGLLNLNSIPEPLLKCLPGKNGGEFAGEVLKRRESGMFESVSEIKYMMGLSEEDYALLFPILTVRSSVFRILTAARRDDLSVSTESIVIKSIRGTELLHFREWSSG